MPYAAPVRQRLRAWAFDRGLALGLVVLVVYVWLAPAHIVAADNAEFATLGEVGGRAHPSGYPLYVLILRATSWLPLGSVAHRASIVTAILAAAQVVALHAACRAWGARASAASITVAMFAAAPIVLRVHTEADVFALNSLLASLILWLAAARGPVTGTTRCALLGLVAGLGLANNLTVALLAPIGVHGVVRGVREGAGARGGLAALGGLALGLVPYAYLPLAPDPASWAPIHSVGDLLATFLRRDYGYVSHLPGGASIPLSSSLAAHALLVARTWLWLPALLGVGALALRCARSEERWSWCLLAASWLLAGPIFASQLGVDPAGVGGYIGGRMQILSALILAIPIAAAFELIADRVPRPLAPPLATGVAIAAFIVLTLVALPRLSRVHSPAVETGVRAMLAPLPPHAIAVVTSEDECFGGRYLQLAEGVRPDVTIVCWPLVTRDWYVARLALPGLGVTAGGLPTPAQAEALIATARPVFVDRAQVDVLAALPNYPLGILHRVLAPGTPLPPAAAVLEKNRAAFVALDLDYPRPDRDDDFAAAAHRRYAATWRILATGLEAAGDRAGAAAAADLSRQLAPE